MANSSFNKHFAALIIIALAVFLIFLLRPFITAILGACVLYVVFKPLHRFLKEKLNLSDRFSASTVIFISIIAVAIPAFVIVFLSVSQVSNVVNLVQNNGHIIQSAQEKVAWLGDFAVGIEEPLKEVFTKFASFAQQTIISAATKVAEYVMGLFIACFVLYFMLVEEKNIISKAHHLIPFNRKNQKKLMREFKLMTKATIYSTGFIAVLQGTILGLLFYFLGVPSPLFWGLVGTVLSFIPVLGTFIIWFPAVLIYALLGQYLVAAWILGGGIFIGAVDNFIRPELNKKFGKVHPLVSVLGIFSGLSLFGMIGILLGPLLLSYFFLTLQMFKEEYL